MQTIKTRLAVLDMDSNWSDMTHNDRLAYIVENI